MLALWQQYEPTFLFFPSAAISRLQIYAVENVG
jgi:hypothetical protein